MRKLKIDWNKVYEQEYVALRKSSRAIAKEQGCAPVTVIDNFHKIGLKTRITNEGKKLSDEWRGKISKGTLGKKKSLEARRKISEGHKGMKFSLEHCKNLSKSLKGRKLSPEHIRNIRIAQGGENHLQWKAGITPIAKTVRSCFRSVEWRKEVFVRDNYTCQDCRERGCFLEAHHIKEFSRIISEHNIKSLEEALLCEELWDVNNGKTLCLKCHNKTKGRNKKVA